MARDESDQKLEKLASALRNGIARLFDILIKDTFHLIDALEEGGIEASVSLEEKEKAIFECDEKLLAFVSLNPRALEIECVPVYV
ncbi:unnamed protein product [Ilex paraguariensis]|uniref:Uncharacterized protein n=1 Tax=Ilex paraguariensis TaxID=185542 RepID=A0ABC8ST33_9AQUA